MISLVLQVVPFYLARDPPDLDSLNLEDDKLKEEIREATAFASNNFVVVTFSLS